MNEYLRIVMLCILTGTICSPIITAAAEIHYHSLIEVRGDKALVEAHTPSEDEYFLCSLDSGTCEEKTESNDPFIPKINGIEPAVTSASGAYGVLQQALLLGNTPTVFYSVYDLRDTPPSFVGLTTLEGSVKETGFSPDESHFVAVDSDGTITIYDIKNRSSHTITINQTDLPFFSISHRGMYIGTYNYLSETHKIWNTVTGALTEISGAPSFIEFNESETEAAYLIERDGYRNLNTVSLDDMESIEEVAHGTFLVEDYIYLDDKLYYLANKETPLQWALYDAESDRGIAENVSYNIFLTRYADNLVYGKIEEKNTDLFVFDGETHARLSAAPLSQRVSGLRRDETTFGGRTAVVIHPTDVKSGDLYVWLHGGPQRQTSIGYHPYLSYAVYDELLENIASTGNYVVKLDYSGSWGYGADFQNLLSGSVGTIEINDIEEAVTEFTGAHDVRNVYLIGNSYGGYMAFRALNALTDEIDGIISINGVADWYTLVQAIPTSPFNDLFGGIPSLATLDAYFEASAFTNTDDIDDQKMLVLYGNEDKTVPPSQSKQYFEFMDANDKNVELVELTGAEHTVTRRENLDELCLSIRDSFEEDLECKS